MTSYRLFEDADRRIDEIFEFSLEQWGLEQATHYLSGLLDKLDDVVGERVLWRTIPAEFEFAGYYCRYERHFLYWRVLDDGRVGFITILHERMQQMELLRAAFEP